MRCLSAAALVLAAFLTGSSAVYAEPPTPGQAGSFRGSRPDAVETRVAATSDGVTIYVGVRNASAGSPGSPGSTEVISGPALPSCTATAMNLPYQSVTSGWMRDELQANPDSMPFNVRCDNGYSAIVWVPLSGGSPPEVTVELLPEDGSDPWATLDAILGIVPLPPITVGANPDTGLVAMPSWYWVEGYGGETLAGSETLDGTTVEVEVWPDRYEWTFGDGHGLTTTSLGAPYPTESDIQHTYEQSSLSQGGAFEVRLDIVFHGRFRVITEEEDEDGEIVVVVGDWEALDSITRSFARPYPVRQLQSVLTAGE